MHSCARSWSLDDEWDDLMIRLGRVLKYDSLFMTATMWGRSLVSAPSSASPLLSTASVRSCVEGSRAKCTRACARTLRSHAQTSWPTARFRWMSMPRSSTSASPRPCPFPFSGEQKGLTYVEPAPDVSANACNMHADAPARTTRGKSERRERRCERGRVRGGKGGRMREQE